MSDSHDDRANHAALGIAFGPDAQALIRLGVELVIEAYERDPDAMLARLANVVARGDEPFEEPSELLVTEYELSLTSASARAGLRCQPLDGGLGEMAEVAKREERRCD